jgi:hypothetical protein
MVCHPNDPASEFLRLQEMSVSLGVREIPFVKATERHRNEPLRTLSVNNTLV